MPTRDSFASLDRDTMIELVSVIFADLNIGMIIYVLEDRDEPSSLRLLYANKAASEYTGADLSTRLNMPIGEAFPALADSELPEAYRDIVVDNRPRSLGAFEYTGDSVIERSFYSVKAFPMPNDCVGVAFENITVRKKIEALLNQKSE